MSWFSTSLLKSQRWPHSSPWVSGTVVILRSFGRSISACWSSTGSSTKYGLELLDPAARAQRVVVVEALVEVDAPVAVRSDALPRLAALLDHAAHGVVRVVDAADRHVAGAHAEGAIAGVHRRLGAIGERPRLAVRAGQDGGRAVALAEVADAAAEQLVHRQAERLALDVPERHVHRARARASSRARADRTRR